VLVERLLLQLTIYLYVSAPPSKPPLTTLQRRGAGGAATEYAAKEQRNVSVEENKIRQQRNTRTDVEAKIRVIRKQEYKSIGGKWSYDSLAFKKQLAQCPHPGNFHNLYACAFGDMGAGVVRRDKYFFKSQAVGLGNPAFQMRHGANFTA
jgi:hypothetical protein